MPELKELIYSFGGQKRHPFFTFVHQVMSYTLNYQHSVTERFLPFLRLARRDNIADEQECYGRKGEESNRIDEYTQKKSGTRQQHIGI